MPQLAGQLGAGRGWLSRSFKIVFPVPFVLARDHRHSQFLVSIWVVTDCFLFTHFYLALIELLAPGLLMQSFRGSCRCSP